MVFDINFFFIFSKLVSAFIILLVYVRLSGSSSLAPASTADVIGNMVIGAMVGGTVLNDSVSDLESIIIVSCWASLLFLVRFLKSRSTILARLLEGGRVQLIKGGVILSGNFIKAQISMDLLQIMLHQNGVNNIHEVEDVWLEANGQLTIEKKGEKDYSVPLVLEGILQKDHLAVIGQDEEWFQSEILKNGFSNVDQIFYAEWSDKKVWFYPYTS